MKKLTIFLLLLVVLSSISSFAQQLEATVKKESSNGGGLVFALITVIAFIVIFLFMHKEGEDYRQEVEQFNRDKRAARMNAHFKEEEIKKGG